jgi:protein-L-isoaspartate(D-aspartate) O-methyltransferase
MKPTLKPPFNPSAKAQKAPDAAPRPAFPVRLRPDAGVPSATKLPASSARLAVGAGPNVPKKTTPAAPTRPGGVGLDSHAVRARMVAKLAAQGVSDPQVLAAMGLVERHRFVDSALVNQAYEDTSLPIGLGQTISKPNVVARMIELLRHGVTGNGKLGRVLEIGTGCGYQAAVLNHVATEVYSIERLRGLHERARTNLRHFRLATVHLMLGDGMIGYAKGAPYAGIIAAAGGEAVPEAWISQLAVGGRIVAPTHSDKGGQALVVIDKTARGLERLILEAVHFVPLKSGIA